MHGDHANVAPMHMRGWALRTDDYAHGESMKRKYARKPKREVTRVQVSRMTDDELIKVLTFGSPVECELAVAELRRRAYIAKYGSFVTERMSPWAVEKREEVFGWRPKLRAARTRND